MNFSMIKYGLLSLSLLAISCEKLGGEQSCFQFDRTICDLEDWAEQVPSDESAAEQEIKMKAFLESQKIKVEQVDLLQDFRETVCYACHCPTADRFSVVIRGSDEKLRDLDLLGLEEVMDCE